MLVIALILKAVQLAFLVLKGFLFAHIILSWFPRGNPTVVRISEVVDSIAVPIISPFRKIVPQIKIGMGAMDLSPLVALIVLDIVEKILFSFIVAVF